MSSSTRFIFVALHIWYRQRHVIGHDSLVIKNQSSSSYNIHCVFSFSLLHSSLYSLQRVLYRVVFNSMWFLILLTYLWWEVFVKIKQQSQTKTECGKRAVWILEPITIQRSSENNRLFNTYCNDLSTILKVCKNNLSVRNYAHGKNEMEHSVAFCDQQKLHVSSATITLIQSSKYSINIVLGIQEALVFNILFYNGLRTSTNMNEYALQRYSEDSALHETKRKESTVISDNTSAYHDN